MPAVQVNPAIDLMNFNRIVPPVVEPEEEFADPLTPEEEKAVAEAEAELARGEYYTWDGDIETIEEFFARINADPIGTMACNMRKNISFC